MSAPEDLDSAVTSLQSLDLAADSPSAANDKLNSNEAVEVANIENDGLTRTEEFQSPDPHLRSIPVPSESMPAEGNAFIPPAPALTIPEAHFDSIDSALMESLQNDNRGTVLKYENFIVQFVASSDPYVELRQHFNSFQRMLFYRVADRFSILHSYNDCNEFGGKSLILCKTASTRPPNPLLADIVIHSSNHHQQQQQQQHYGSGHMGGYAGGMPVGMNAPYMQPAGHIEEQHPKRVLIKRPSNKARDGSGSNPTTAGGSGKSWQSGEDRERMYAEAKARIFSVDGSSPSLTGEGSSESVSASNRQDTQQSGLTSHSTDDSPEPATPTHSGKENVGTPTLMKDSAAAPAAPGLASGLDTENSSTTVTITQLHSASAAAAIPQHHNNSRAHSGGYHQGNDNSFNHSNRNNSKKSGNWKGNNKYTLRDYDTEKSDPDFARRSNASQAYRQSNPNFHQQHQPQQQQQHHQQQQHQSQHMQQHHQQHQQQHQHQHQHQQQAQHQAQQQQLQQQSQGVVYRPSVSQQASRVPMSHTGNGVYAPKGAAVVVDQSQQPNVAYAPYQNVATVPNSIYFQPQLYPVPMVAQMGSQVTLQPQQPQLQTVDSRYGTVVYAPSNATPFWTTAGSVPNVLPASPGMTVANVGALNMVGVGPYAQTYYTHQPQPSSAGPYSSYAYPHQVQIPVQQTMQPQIKQHYQQVQSLPHAQHVKHIVQQSPQPQLAQSQTNSMSHPDSNAGPSSGPTEGTR